MRGGYLYEHRPDLFPQGRLTEEELTLWATYYEMRNDERKAAERGLRR